MIIKKFNESSEKSSKILIEDVIKDCLFDIGRI